MSSLDSILKNSLSQASSHTKEVYSQNPLTASEVIELANSRVLTLAATVRPDGRPHLSPTDLVVVNGVFYLGVDMAMALADGWKRQAILEGNAEFLDIKSETAKEVLEAQKKKYGWATDTLAEFTLTRAFTWKAK